MMSFQLANSPPRPPRLSTAKVKVHRHARVHVKKELSLIHTHAWLLGCTFQGGPP